VLSFSQAKHDKMAEDMEMVEKTTSILKNAIKEGGWPQSEYFIVNIHVNIHVSIASPTSSIRKLEVCLSYMIAILFLKNHGS
jgi:hypothetical protein